MNQLYLNSMYLEIAELLGIPSFTGTSYLIKVRTSLDILTLTNQHSFKWKWQIEFGAAA